MVGKPEVSTLDEKSPCRMDDCAELYSRVTGKEEALKTSRLGPRNAFPAPISALLALRASARDAPPFLVILWHLGLRQNLVARLLVNL
jgi:hypothetical protein